VLKQNVVNITSLEFWW